MILKVKNYVKILFYRYASSFGLVKLDLLLILSTSLNILPTIS